MQEIGFACEESVCVTDGKKLKSPSNGFGVGSDREEKECNSEGGEQKRAAYLICGNLNVAVLFWYSS